MYTNGGLDIFKLAGGFHRSNNPNKDEIIAFIYDAIKDIKKEKAIIDACHISAGVNKLSVVYETMSLDFIMEIYGGE